MLNLSDFKHIAPFFAPLVGRNSREPEREWVWENNAYLWELQKLAERKPEVRREFFEELENLGRYFPEAPDGSLAHLFICRAAAALAGSWDIPRLVEMLFWEQIINAREISYISVLLKAIRKKGCEEDTELLEKFYHELGKLQRYYYRDGTGALIPFPAIVRLREEVKEVINRCRTRGLRDAELKRKVSGVLLWSSAGY